MKKPLIVDKLYLRNFRCYNEIEINLRAGTNIICGSNASGKTSLLEGIYVLAMTKSFRSTSEDSLFGFKGPEYLIKGEFNSENNIKSITLLNSNNCKKIKVGHVIEKKVSSYIGFINVVAFSPSDMELILNSPASRRNFFDSILCQTDQAYLRRAMMYRKLLKERNAILKQIAQFNRNDKSLSLLDVLTEQLIACAKVIISKRHLFIDEISHEAAFVLGQISNNNEQLIINYRPSATIEELETKVKTCRNEEIKRGVTLFGPHRDDYAFTINDKNIVSYASQGQKKSCAICCRLACVAYITKIKERSPIVLLDDVLSELDKKRQNALMALFKDDVQVIITTTTLTDIDEKLIEKAHVLFLEERKVKYEQRI